MQEDFQIWQQLIPEELSRASTLTSTFG